MVEGLRYESHTSYTVDAGAAAVHVVFDATITNQQPDRRTADGVLHYFFPTTAVPVLAEATNFAATRDDGRALTVRREAESDDQFAVAVVDLVPDLDYGQTTHFRLTYDLPHLAPRSAGFTRVNVAFATFAAFGYGDPGLTSFEIRVPDGFKVEFTGVDLKQDEVDGMQRWVSGPLDDPDNTFAVVAARHDDGLLTRPLVLDDHKVVIRAWPDDPQWGTFVERELTKGIPSMESLVGLAWPHPDDELSIVEAASPYIYGYAGWFLPETNSIEVGDDLDPRSSCTSSVTCGSTTGCSSSDGSVRRSPRPTPRTRSMRSASRCPRPVPCAPTTPPRWRSRHGVIPRSPRRTPTNARNTATTPPSSS